MDSHTRQTLDHDFPTGLRHRGHDQRPLRIPLFHRLEERNNRRYLPQRNRMDPDDRFLQIPQFDRHRPKPAPKAALTAFFCQQESDDNGKGQYQQHIVHYIIHESVTRRGSHLYRSDSGKTFGEEMIQPGRNPEQPIPLEP